MFLKDVVVLVVRVGINGQIETRGSGGPLFGHFYCALSLVETVLENGRRTGRWCKNSGRKKCTAITATYLFRPFYVGDKGNETQILLLVGYIFN